ncbi:MAG: sugar ABC transporter permease [Bifidobacteriaceae bacterium]|jgi:raffinose/stachyose/melibiose transport system permease protein|nr:sugar ABC transporter permease [Bifidobacteriaceae bacterium]
MSASSDFATGTAASAAVAVADEGAKAGGGRGQTRPPSRTSRSRGRGIGWRGRFEVALLTGPALIIFISFVILPVVLAAWFGFYRWKGYGMPSDFIGLDNYRWILEDKKFLAALSHNGFVLGVSLATQGVVALGMALLLNRKIRFRSVIRVLIFAPYVISEAIVGTGWRLLMQPNGAFSNIMDALGLDGLAHTWWLGDKAIAPWTMMMIVTWKYVGFYIILFLAGMQGIPEELYEAAAIDGCSYWRMQLKITLPLLSPTIKIWGFLTIIGSMQFFDLVYIMWGPTAEHTGVSTVATYIRYEGSEANAYGYGSAAAVILFIITFTLAILYQKFIMNRGVENPVAPRRGR